MLSGKGAHPSTGWYVESHDLAASKLVADREKDRRFVRTLIVEQLVRADVLIDRVRSLPIDQAKCDRLTQWINAIAGSNSHGMSG